MLTIYRRGRVYWTRRREGATQIRRSLQTTDLQTARALARQMELEMLSGERSTRTSWPQFADEFLRWIESQVRPNTIKGYRFTADRFGRFLKQSNIVDLVDIHPKTFADYTEQRQQDTHPSWGTQLGPGGMRFDLRVLRRIFAHAVENGYIATNPVRARNLNSIPGKTVPFTQKEVAKMLADPELQRDLRLRAIVLTFLNTGLRISDVVSLEKPDVKGNVLYIRTQKRGRIVAVRIHSELRKALDAHFAAANPAQKLSRYVFSLESGRRMTHRLDKMLRRLWKRCGIERGHAHKFRDTFAVRLLAKGASLYDVAKLMGISMQTAERHYSPYTPELQRRGARLIDSLDFSK